MLKKHGQNHFQFLPGEISLNAGVLTPSEGQKCSTFYLSFRKALGKKMFRITEIAAITLGNERDDKNGCPFSNTVIAEAIVLNRPAGKAPDRRIQPECLIDNCIKISEL
jgi:hypothetical protein